MAAGRSRDGRPLALSLLLPFLFFLVATDAKSHHHHNGGHLHHHRRRVPVLDLHGADGLTALLREDATLVDLQPPLAVLPETGPVCSYELWDDDASEKKQEPLPFSIQVEDSATGAARLKVEGRKAVDCAQRSLYNLHIIAVRCDEPALRSEPVKLTVTVKDTNDHAPEFDEPWYTFAAPERGPAEEVVGKVRATDADCGHPYGEICQYEITNAQTHNLNAHGAAQPTETGLDAPPFTVDRLGVIRNTRSLNRTAAHSYILTVVAHDCGQRRSKSALVTINVEAKCSTGWSGLPEKMDYTAGEGARPLLVGSAPHLVVCKENNSEGCPGGSMERVEATVELETNEQPDGCSRDTLFNNYTIQTCNLNANTINLLPSWGTTNKTSKDIDAADEDDDDVDDDDDEGLEEKNESAKKPVDRFYFDGTTNAVVVPSNVVNGLIPDVFTLSFSMRRKRSDGVDDGHKHTILCESDERELNRHHMSVYVRHCRLEVVLRREAGSAEQFRAAEWRWSLDEVCDAKWHSYSLLFNGVDDVHLLIDGRQLPADDRNPEILDDWPLHEQPVPSAVSTRLVVGACWHARAQHMAQFFKGHLSSVFLLRGAVESAESVACAHRCPQQLLYTATDQLTPGQSATWNTEQTRLVLVTDTASTLANMLRHVAYTNQLARPAPGRRTVRVSAKGHCSADKTKTVELGPVAEIAIDVRSGAAGQAAAVAQQTEKKRKAVSVTTTTATPATSPTSTSTSTTTAAGTTKATKATTTATPTTKGTPASSVAAKPEPTMKERAVRQIRLSLADDTAVVGTTRRAVAKGSAMLPKLQIAVTTEDGDQAVEEVNESTTRLDWCKLHLRPGRDSDLEYFSSPAVLIASTHIHFEHDQEGVLLRGRDTARNYATVLQHIHYFNTQSSSFPRRVYALKCGARNQDGGASVESNELVTTMEIASNDDETAVQSSTSARPPVLPLAAVASSSFDLFDRHFEPASSVFDPVVSASSARLQNILEMDVPRAKPFARRAGRDLRGSAASQGTMAGSAVAVAVVICVGFLLVLLVVGVLKLKDGAPATRRRGGAGRSRRSRRTSTASKDGLEWDDSGMKIIVNPLDVMTVEGGVAGDAIPGEATHFDIDELDDEVDDDDDDDDEEDDYEDDDEEDELDNSHRRRHHHQQQHRAVPLQTPRSAANASAVINEDGAEDDEVEEGDDDDDEEGAETRVLPTRQGGAPLEWDDQPAMPLASSNNRRRGVGAPKRTTYRI